MYFSETPQLSLVGLKRPTYRGWPAAIPSGSSPFSPCPVCSSIADMPLCVLVKRAGMTTSLGVVCVSKEGSLRVGPSRAAIRGGGRGAGLGAEMECCPLKSKGILSSGQAAGLKLLRSLPSFPVASMVIARSCHREGLDVEMKMHL